MLGEDLPTESKVCNMLKYGDLHHVLQTGLSKDGGVISCLHCKKLMYIYKIHVSCSTESTKIVMFFSVDPQ